MTLSSTPKPTTESDVPRTTTHEGAWHTPLSTLGDCPPGLFLFEGCLGFKSEYCTESTRHPGFYQCDAYVVESGEYFWGGAEDAKTRETLMVIPIDCDTALAIASPPMTTTAGDAEDVRLVNELVDSVFALDVSDNTELLRDAEYLEKRTALLSHISALRAAIAERDARVLERESLLDLVMDQYETDLKLAHAEICKLQGLDPATRRWPDWTPQANTLRWFEKIRADLPARAALPKGGA